jgi:very-short-patch-repair endonuclease
MAAPTAADIAPRVSAGQHGHAPSDVIRAALMSILERRSEGFELFRILHFLRAARLHASPALIAEELLRLQRDGLARIAPDRRWTWTVCSGRQRPGPQRPDGSLPEDHAAYDGQRLIAVRGMVALAGGRRQTTLEAHPSGAVEPGVGVLRQLLPFYRECLVRNESRDTNGNTEGYGKQFLFCRPQGRWWPELGCEGRLRIERAHLPEEFLAGLSRRKAEPLILSYPVHYVRPRNDDTPPFVLPVAAVACGWSLTADSLEIAIPAETPRFASDWLKDQRFRGRDTSDLARWAEPEDAENGKDTPFQDWRSVAERAQIFAAADVRAPIEPAHLADALDLSDRAGMYNLLGIFLPSELRFARGAAREIGEIAAWPEHDLASTALAAVFSKASETETATDTVPVPSAGEPLELGQDQLAALRDALRGPLTVVTGPPGTGKSQVVAAIMACAALEGRSVLLASRNHKALDAVEERIRALVADKPLLTRANTDEDSAGFSFERAIESIIARPAASGRRERLAEAVDQIRRLDDLRAAAYRRLDDEAAAADTLGRIVEEIDTLEAELGAEAAGWMLHAPKLPDLDRPPWWARLLPRRLVRHVLMRAVNRLRPPEAVAPLDEEHLETWRAAIGKGARLRAALAERNRVEAELRRFDTADRPDLTEYATNIRNRSTAALRTLVDVLAECEPSHRAELTDLRGEVGLNQRGGAVGAERYRELWMRAKELIFRHFPLWAVSNLGVSSKIPLIPGFFDILIIDEASQCDIASAIPLLARARSAVVVGDPAQLKHITKVDHAWEVDALRAAGLYSAGIGRYSFVANSLFHLAAAAGGRQHLLRDHYRCHPDIADYISDTFYGQRLRALTAPAAIRPPPGTPPGFHWTSVAGSINAAASGCWSRAEADAICAHLRALLLDQRYRGSVGIVTPFVAQAERLRERLEAEIPADIRDAVHLTIATAHKFQGDARDLMVFSLCLGPDMPRGALGFVATTPNLVNVAVSRARAVCHVFGNLEFAVTCGIGHIQALVARRNQRSVDRIGTFDSPWEKRFHDALLARGIATVPQLPVAGRRLDLAIVDGGRMIDVEVDGDRWHRDVDGNRKQSDYFRDLQLRSLGWKVLRFWVYDLREDMEGCVERVVREL